MPIGAQAKKSERVSVYVRERERGSLTAGDNAHRGRE